MLHSSADNRKCMHFFIFLYRHALPCALYCRVLDRFYVDLEPLFALDPLALQTFLYICPRAELKTVFGLIPPNVSIAWVSYMIFNLFSNIGPSTVSCMGIVLKCEVEAKKIFSCDPFTH